MRAMGDRIKQKREDRGWPQVELARQMLANGWPHYTQLMVSRTETAQRPVPIDEAIVLAQVLGVSLEWLALGGPEAIDDQYPRGYRDGLVAARKAIEDLAV